MIGSQTGHRGLWDLCPAMRTQSKHYEAFAVLTALKFWPQRSVNHPQSDIFSKSWECLGWRDYPSPLTITWLYVISSTMTSTDHSLPQRVYCSLHVSFLCLWNTARLRSVFACGREESHHSLRWKFHSAGMSSPVPVEYLRGGSKS